MPTSFQEFLKYMSHSLYNDPVLKIAQYYSSWKIWIFPTKELNKAIDLIYVDFWS